MKAIDFEYDGLLLSDFGMMLADFDNNGLKTTALPEITFNTVASQNGIYHHLTSVQYDDCATFTLHICKNVCDNSDFEITLDDFINLARWLNRKNFYKFRLIEDDYSGISCNASFNISKIEMCGKIVGIELEAITDSPFMYRDPVTIKFDAEPGIFKDIYNKSDVPGHIYPNMTIEVKEAGDFKMRNMLEDRTMIINGCEDGEVITIEYPMISSSLGDKRKAKIMNDFNWEFFRLASTFRNRLNTIDASLPCSIEITYSPIVKAGI